MKPFRALVLRKKDNQISRNIEELMLDDLPKGEVLVRVAYSGINYKDSLASMPDGRIVRSYPFVPGIDLSGIIVSSEDARFKAGDPVIATSYQLGVSHFGGYSEYARIPADWVVPLPKELSLREAMVIGTAGFTAALSVLRLEENHVAPDQGKVLVTGATGGVGSFAVSILSGCGYSVTASTGKSSEHAYLNALGAQSVIVRDDVYDGSLKPLQKQEWAAAIDPVGGKPLAALLSKIHYGGSVAVCGLTAGSDLPATVFPFILRGINLLGIDSVFCPMNTRMEVWARLAQVWKPKSLEPFVQNEMSLDQLPAALPTVLRGQARGRILVKIGEDH
ncbi:acryloyl-CoA reductase [Sporolactobacillus kofuensis]|uniref:Acryloyl-CoA reductase n=1 Tax=Sporolactobacillus kofuensis TaxID=269672 RepID=A0ABW1WFV0_9BACL|nr:acryloyl-CoA reductase [Sporolactobacillus kofuensis]MCO7175201.1 acryloyl-CoA reductase [Sporolactobacillus kofuensis]